MQIVSDYNKLPQFQVAIDGHRIHYVDVGDGPPVFLIHGSPLSSYSFRHQIEPLATRFRVIAPDLPGFGQSEALEKGPVFVQQARLLRNFLHYLDLEPFRLLGHDWGGPIGLAAVADHPGHIRQLVLVNTTLRSDFKPPIYWRQFTTSYLGELLLVRLNVFGWGLPLMMRAASSVSVRRHYLHHLKDHATRRTVLALERLEGFTDLMEQVELVIPSMKMSVMILWGYPDAYFKRLEMKHLTDLFPNATVREIEGGGHFPMDDMPLVVTDALLKFLA
jgi:haloalkane dehalogenase